MWLLQVNIVSPGSLCDPLRPLSEALNLTHLRGLSALLHLYAQIKERYLDNGAITSEQYFEDWPTFNAAESEWRDVVTSFYSLLWSSPLRLIHTQGNRWVQCDLVIEADHTFSDAQDVTQYLVSQGQQLFPADGVRVPPPSV